MKLKEYFEQHDISRAAFAAEVKTTEASLSRYINGQRSPRRPLRKRIVAATKNKVTEVELI